MTNEDPFSTPEWREWAERVKAELLPMISDSAMNVSLVPTGDTDIKFAVELGLSIMMDKPILALVHPGTKVPAHLVRVADRIMEVDIGRMSGHDGRKVQARILQAMEDLIEGSAPPQRTIGSIVIPPPVPNFAFNDADDLKTKVYQAVGAASACWTNLAGAGVFDDARAAGIAEALLAAIDADRTEAIKAPLASPATPIEDLKLTVRTYNLLKREGLHSIGDLIELTPEAILQFRNANQTTVEDCQRKLTAVGFSLKS